jgi:hypothetical protein
MTFISVGVQLYLYYLIGEFAKEHNIPITEIIFDPDEVGYDAMYKDDIEHTLYFGYSIPHINAKKLDFFQYVLEKCYTYDVKIEKNIDFIFGYSISVKSRLYLAEASEKIKSQFNNSKVFIKNRFEKINTLVSRDLYFEYLKRSRFTMIAPAYNKDTFSCFRFLEAIHFDCLPLVLSECSYTDFRESYDIDKEIFNEILIKNYIIPEISEERRVYLIEYLKGKCLKIKDKIW